MKCCDVSFQIIIAIKKEIIISQQQFLFFAQLLEKVEKVDDKVQRGIEPRSIDSKSNVLTTTLLDQ